jgi:hypothetical protein
MAYLIHSEHELFGHDEFWRDTLGQAREKADQLEFVLEGYSDIKIVDEETGKEVAR